MSSPTRDIEKESLEAHVELCAARYSRLEEKLDNLEGRVIGIETVLGEIRDTIVKDREKRQTQLITWGVAIIGSLATAVAVLSYNLFT
jgi:chromosome segregation ATPase